MLNIDPFTILATLINLVILFILMKLFLFDRVNKVLQERQQLVADTLAKARADRDEAAHLKEEYEQYMAQSRKEAAEILEKARQRGDAAYQKTMEQAQSDAHSLMEESTKRTAHDRQMMLQSLREEMATLVVEAAQKVVQSNQVSIDEFMQEEGETK